MKISLTHYGETVSIEWDHDDVTLEALWEIFERLALLAGYGEKTVKEMKEADDDRS